MSLDEYDFIESMQEQHYYEDIAYFNEMEVELENIKYDLELQFEIEQFDRDYLLYSKSTKSHHKMTSQKVA